MGFSNLCVHDFIMNNYSLILLLDYCDILVFTCAKHENKFLFFFQVTVCIKFLLSHRMFKYTHAILWEGVLNDTCIYIYSDYFKTV